MSLSELIFELQHCTRENTSEFTFENKEFICKCISVYDGDTITVAFKPFGEKIYRYNIRLLGIDTPEIRTKNLSEKAMGIKVRDILRKKILNKIISLKCGKFDKYGRLLGEVYINDTNSKNNNKSINQWLIDEGMAYVYDGGTKRTEPIVKFLTN